MSVSKEQKDSIPKAIARQYMHALRKQPLVTKSCTRWVGDI